MLKFLFNALNVKQDERLPVGLMLGAGFFMGIFLATYQVTAESLFINKLSDQLDKAFLISGVLGIVSTLVFSYLQNRVKFTTLTISSVVTIVLVTTLVYVLYHLRNETIHNYVLFGMFCLIGPMTAILLLVYWGIFGRLFNFKQSKRIIGWIDTGQLIAAIISYFVIPLTSSFFPDTSNYLVICNVSIFFSLTCLVFISLRFKLAKNNPNEFDNTVVTETRFNKIFEDKYIVLLSVFLIISMITYVLNQYSFQSLINKQYPDQRNLTNFLAFFNGALYILSFVMQTFVNDKIMSNFGLKISLFILPLVVGIFSLFAFLSGAIFGYDLVTAPTTFIFFFLFVALTRLFNGSLRDSLENPVFKLLFIPLDARYRFSIQSKVEGVVNETGRLIAGLLIFSFALLPFFKIIYIPIILLLLAVAYILVTSNLHNGYKSKIRAKLENREFKQDKLEIGFAQVTAKLQALLVDNQSSRAIFSFKLLEKIEPSKVPSLLNVLMKNDHDEVREYAQRKMNEIKGLSVSDKYVIKIDSDRVSRETKNVISRLDLESILKNGGDFSRTRIMSLIRSHERGDRQYAAELLLNSTTDENVSLLIELLNDSEPLVRNTAIKTATKRYNTEVILSLIENVNNPLYTSQAMTALVSIGEPALGLLEGCFYRTGQTSQILTKVIQVIGRIGGAKSKDILWNKIDFPDKVVVSQILLSLGESGFKAGISQITRIKYAIESDMADIRWNIGALLEIGDDVEEIAQALEWENQNDIAHIYMLLAMLYDTSSIQLVKENIESGTTEGTTYAIELLDVFLSDQLKQRVIPILDDLTLSEKNSRLDLFYPRIKLDEKLVLKFLINRDFTQTNRWTKSCVIKQIGTLRIRDFTLDLIAQLFNQDKLIREISAWSLFQIDALQYENNSLRLGDSIKRELDAVILHEGTKSRLMLYDIISFYRKIELFNGMPGIALSNIADITIQYHLLENQSMVIDEKSNPYFFVFYSGVADYYFKGEKKNDLKRGQLISEVLSTSGFLNSNQVIAKEPSILLQINKDSFYELLSTDASLSDRVLEFI